MCRFSLVAFLVVQAMVMAPTGSKKKTAGRIRNKVDNKALWSRLQPFSTKGLDYVTRDQLHAALQAKDEFGQLVALPSMHVFLNEIDKNKDGSIEKVEALNWAGYEEKEFCRTTGDRSYGCLDRCVAGIDRGNGYPGYFEHYSTAIVPGFTLALGNVGAGAKTYNGQVTPAQEAAIHAALKELMDKGVQGSIAALGLHNTPIWRSLFEAVKHDASRKLYLFDTFKGAVQCDHSKDTGMCPKVGSSKMSEEYLKGDLSTWGSPSGDEAKERKNRIVVHNDYSHEKDIQGKLAFAFVDGSVYPTVSQMLHTVMPHMAEGGIIAVHDFGWEGYPGVEHAITEHAVGRGYKVVLPSTEDGVACYLGFVQK